MQRALRKLFAPGQSPVRATTREKHSVWVQKQLFAVEQRSLSRENPEFKHCSSCSRRMDNSEKRSDVQARANSSPIHMPSQNTRTDGC
jgi:hypothetical protein